ncbi:hypothetical protein BBP40_003795 [Aspergillus hancockii]|nr:hypothetical protein BBP40_003795 [Aspergillus hancockii]
MTPILLLVASAATVLIYQYLVFPAFVSPLSRLPHAHFSSRFCDVWIKWQRYRGRGNKAIHQAHNRLGPIIRIGLTEVSVNCPKAIKIVYSDLCDRDEWYSRAFQDYGKQNMFSYTKREPHAARKRMVAPVYSKSTLYSSPEIVKISQVLLKERLLHILQESAKREVPIDMQGLSLAYGMDYICAYLFGLHNAPDFLRQQMARETWLEAHEQGKQSPQSWVAKFLAVSLFTDRQNNDPSMAEDSLERARLSLCLDLMDRVKSDTRSGNTINSIEQEAQTRPVVYEHLAPRLITASESGEGDMPKGRIGDHLTLASELLDHIKAGTETTGWSLTYVLYELSRHSTTQMELSAELCALPELRLSDSLCASVIGTGTLKRLDKIPLLEAIILETLRLHPAVAGPQPRVTLAKTALLGYTIPPKTRISAQAYSLHQNEEVYEDAKKWNPYRWINAASTEKTEMKKWFWAFGSGGRMCVGNWLALLELKLAVAGVYANFTTRVVDDEGIEQGDGYSTGPVMKRTMLAFDRFD